MLTRRQIWFLGIWVGSPFALYMVLFVINPGYMAHFTGSIESITGASLVFGCQAINLLVLFAGFARLNNRREAVDVEIEKRSKLFSQRTLLFFTLLMFTLPSIWLVIFYPTIYAASLE